MAKENVLLYVCVLLVKCKSGFARVQKATVWYPVSVSQFMMSGVFFIVSIEFPAFSCSLTTSYSVSKYDDDVNYWGRLTITVLMFIINNNSNTICRV